MLERGIPSTHEILPVIGIGTWQTFDVGTSAAERAPLEAVLETFDQMGGTAIDSSPMYGRSEEVVGDLVAKTLESAVRTSVAQVDGGVYPVAEAHEAAGYHRRTMAY